jgi:hypothetical protein
MDMTHALHSDMIEATRLTGAGRLVEATALLQRTLQGKAAPSSTSRPTGGEHPTIDGVAEPTETEGPP